MKPRNVEEDVKKSTNGYWKYDIWGEYYTYISQLDVLFVSIT